ncbi:DUF3108 domain-containing protein [Variovorax sp. GT1P44]|uniref:DUF3108 domain-containing protein n=1 Tax=Variovorax sp. GT1P44 TaxID=3443742 RepID=UPI003F46E5E9
MPTLASPTPPHTPRLPWRTLAALTVAVAAAHLLLLGVTPVLVGPKPSPLESKFTTRTIVIAPAAAAPPAPAPVAEAKPPPRPARPRPPAHPRPAPPAAEPETPAVPDSPAPDLYAQNAIDAGVAEAPDSGATASGPGQGAPDAAATAPANDDSAANMPGSVPLRIPGSVRLSLAATAQVGATPMSGVFGELVWLHDGEHYDARLTLKFLFATIRGWQSTGAIGKTGIEPLRYADKRRKSEVASHFVRDQGKVVFSNNAPSETLLPGAQDQLSVLMQLSAMLAGDPGRYPPGSVIAVQTVGPRSAEIWTFSVSEDEQLTVPAGDFTVRKLTRNPRLPFDDKVEVWLAPALGYLPVRLKLTQAGGDFADMQLRAQEPLRATN